jgi:hypothetical protein
MRFSLQIPPFSLLFSNKYPLMLLLLFALKGATAQTISNTYCLSLLFTAAHQPYVERVVITPTAGKVLCFLV